MLSVRPDSKCVCLGCVVMLVCMHVCMSDVVTNTDWVLQSNMDRICFCQDIDLYMCVYMCLQVYCLQAYVDSGLNVCVDT